MVDKLPQLHVTMVTHAQTVKLHYWSMTIMCNIIFGHECGIDSFTDIHVLPTSVYIVYYII